MAKTQSLKFKLLVAAAPAEVFAAFSHASALTGWLCDVAEADARLGGRLYLWWNDGYYTSGEYTLLHPAEKLAFQWRGRGELGDSTVRVALSAEEDGHTLVAVTHGGLGVGKVWKETVRGLKKGWLSALENLQSVLETGQDLRFVNRPMLGLSGAEVITAEIAAKEALPCAGGVRLTGLLPGMGAEAAGLQKGDIIVKLGGKKITVYDDLPAALSEFRAGDTIKAVFYRADEKQTVKITLSRRPLPDIPASIAALTETLAANNRQANRELFRALRGATDEQASFHLAPGEWNIKEILSHLISDERDRLTWLAGVLAGHEAREVYQSNPGRIQAIVATYPSLPRLRRELKRCQDEVLALLHVLPPDFAARKGVFWRTGFLLLGGVDHLGEHVPQVAAALEAARKDIANP